MKIVSPSKDPRHQREIRFTTGPKALVATGVSVVWVLVCVGAWSFDYSQAACFAVSAIQLVLAGTSVCLWRLERPRELRFKGRFPEPPIIHSV